MHLKRLAVLWLCVSATASMSLAADPPWNGRLILTLDKALLQIRSDGKANPEEAKPIDLYLTCQDGVWTDLWGSAQNFNRNIHDGKVLSRQVEGDRVRLKVQLGIEPDNWVKGGTAAWDIDLKLAGDRAEGKFSGAFQGVGGAFEAKEQPVRGIVLPPNPVRQGFQPPAPGEHPRLLFRKADLPKIKQRLDTPLGKFVLERLRQSKDPIAMGMMFQLTGERSYAEQAWPLAEAEMANRDQGPFAIGREWGYKTQRISLIFDLCYDGWTDEQRERTAAYFSDVLDMCLNRKHTMTYVNWSPGSNYTVVIHAGNGMAAMAMVGEKGFPPAEPVAPRTSPAKLAAPADFRPGKGVPAAPLPIGGMPTEWLVAGPFFLHYQSGEDPLASIGGMAKARPEEGQAVQFRSQRVPWRTISKTANPDYFGVGGQGGPQTYGVPKDAACLLTPKIAGREMTRLFIYAVVDVAQPGWYRFKGNYWSAVCFINGERFADGEIVHLDKGRYPWLLHVMLGAPTGTARPVFEEAAEADAAKLYGDPNRQAAYENARNDYQAARKGYDAAGGVNATWAKWARLLEHWNVLNLQNGMQEGGFQGEGEGYTLECHQPVHDYALAFRNVFGRELTGRNDIGYFAPRYVATTVWMQDAKKARPDIQTFGRGVGTIDAPYLARSIDLVPPAWRGAVQWFWHKRQGLPTEPIADEAGARQLVEGLQTIPLIQAFLRYPLDRKPENPGTAMPRAWQSKGRGFYAFRNQWKDSDDIVAQIYGKTGQSCGWNQPEAGCFQILAFGHEMARKINDAAGKTGSRWFDNVVMLPEDPVDCWDHGKTVFYSGDPKTGSGVVTFDMGDVYTCLREGKDKKIERFDGGIKGLRSFAADCSGSSGAPGLFAVVDDITGGKTKQWVFQLPETGRDGPDWTLDIKGNTFTIAWKDGASLQATFVSPAKVAISKAEGILKAHPLSKAADVSTNALLVSGEDPTDGKFFVILTVQKGSPAPQVQVQGSGLGAKAKIGGQTVRYDGQKVLLGQ